MPTEQPPSQDAGRDESIAKRLGKHPESKDAQLDAVEVRKLCY